MSNFLYHLLNDAMKDKNAPYPMKILGIILAFLFLFLSVYCIVLSIENFLYNFFSKKQEGIVVKINNLDKKLSVSYDNGGKSIDIPYKDSETYYVGEKLTFFINIYGESSLISPNKFLGFGYILLACAFAYAIYTIILWLNTINLRRIVSF